MKTTGSAVILGHPHEIKSLFLKSTGSLSSKQQLRYRVVSSKDFKVISTLYARIFALTAKS